MKKYILLVMLVPMLGGCAAKDSKSERVNYDPEGRDKSFFYKGWLNPKEIDHDAAMPD